MTPTDNNIELQLQTFVESIVLFSNSKSIRKARSITANDGLDSRYSPDHLREYGIARWRMASLLDWMRKHCVCYRKPAINVVEGEGVEAEWLAGTRSLTLTTDGIETSLLRSWGPDPVTEMADYSIERDQDMANHWTWLHGE